MNSLRTSLSVNTTGFAPSTAANQYAPFVRAAVSQPLVWGAYSFDKRATVLTVNKVPMKMTQKEFDLALLLFSQLGKSVTRAELFEKVWGREAGFKSRTLDTHVARIRQRLGLIPENGFRLTSIYRLGYRLDAV